MGIDQLAIKRVKLDKNLVADVMFASDRTCCVCNVSGRRVHIHHIDEDRSNNDPSNLAVVCTYCHEDIHDRHGFTRKFSPELVTKYRDLWNELVASKRKAAVASSDNDKFIQEAIEQLSDRYLEAAAKHSEKEYISKMMTGRMAIDVAQYIGLLIECRHRNSDEQGAPLPDLRKLCVSALQLAIAYGVDEVQEIHLREIADKLIRLFPGENVFPDGKPTCSCCDKGIDAHR